MCKYLYCTEGAFLKDITYVSCSKKIVVVNKGLLALCVEITQGRYGLYEAKQIAEFIKTVLIFCIEVKLLSKNNKIEVI
jgi:hypothetical protein